MKDGKKRGKIGRGCKEDKVEVCKKRTEWKKVQQWVIKNNEREKRMKGRKREKERARKVRETEKGCRKERRRFKKMGMEKRPREKVESEEDKKRWKSEESGINEKERSRKLS